MLPSRSPRPLVDDVRARVRRVVSLAVPPIVLVVLVLVGRWAATTRPAEIAILAAASAAPLTDDGGAADAAVIDAAGETTEGGADTEKSALEQLADGAVIVDLNLATDVELRRLPGIGKARARAILDLRARLGRFKGVDDLARIKGFGRAMLRRLRPLTRV